MYSYPKFFFGDQEHSAEIPEKSFNGHEDDHPPDGTHHRWAMMSGCPFSSISTREMLQVPTWLRFFFCTSSAQGRAVRSVLMVPECETITIFPEGLSARICSQAFSMRLRRVFLFSSGQATHCGPQWNSEERYNRIAPDLPEIVAFTLHFSKTYFAHPSNLVMGIEGNFCAMAVAVCIALPCGLEYMR
jgi:hypothetical protein